tara:strand:+ start:3140 stop:3460 length:321 start_codon:yes stop_codon:yes gene_type:complete
MSVPFRPSKEVDVRFREEVPSATDKATLLEGMVRSIAGPVVDPPIMILRAFPDPVAVLFRDRRSNPATPPSLKIRGSEDGTSASLSVGAEVMTVLRSEAATTEVGT